MTIENPIEETPIEPKPPTLEEQLASALARCEELYATSQKQAQTIGSMQVQKATDDAAIAALRERVRVVEEETLPNERAAVEKTIAALQAQLVEYGQIVDRVMAAMLGKTEIKKVIQQKAFGLLLSDPKSRESVKTAIAVIEAE